MSSKHVRISRRNLMLAISRQVGQRGTCPRARVGCVIERDGRILAIGYNGSPPGMSHCDDVGCLMVNGHCTRTTHAEANAVAWSARVGAKLDGATLYTTGWSKGCCDTCQKLALSAGIVEIVTEVVH